MLLADQHIHSNCSPDGFHTMTEMAQTSFWRGVGTICFTDHIDLEDSETGAYNPDYLSPWNSILQQYSDAVAACEGIDLRLGIELGAINHHPEIAAEALALKELDFVIGSVHNNRGLRDFYFLEYESEEHCLKLLDDYMLDNLELAEVGGFDVLGHLGYAPRYMRRQGFQSCVTIERHGDVIDAIFRRLIDSGLGIEINCSGFRDGMGSIPTLPILRRYRELGGEIITIGTDAHTLDNAGTFLAEGYGVLVEAGFKYFTQFKGRKPEFKSVTI